MKQQEHVYAWLSRWREKLPDLATSQLQDILGPLTATASAKSCQFRAFGVLPCNREDGHLGDHTCAVTPDDVPPTSILLRYDIACAANDGPLRAKLVELGWTPPPR